MFAFDPVTVSMAPAILVAGLCLMILPLFRPDHAVVRAGALALVVLLAWRYMAWRFTSTLAPLEWSVDAVASWTFALLEGGTVVSSTLAFLILSRTRDRKREADDHAGWWRPGPAPRVDILIASYNEEAAILERTIAGALAARHVPTRVWVLDDGRRPWLRELCDRLGANYLTRADNAHAKAGNINAGLKVLAALPDPPDFVAVLDADFVPHRDFVHRALALFHDPKVGLVQTPQHFFNPDPIQHNLGIERAYPDEQRFFFDHIQPARDAWGIAFCCGTSSVMRWSALMAIGGFPTGSVTEDFLITLRFQEEGYSTVYLNEALTEGLAPEGLGEYITQRGRWCLGLIQIVRGPMGPFSKSRLRLVDRLGLLDSFLYWASTYPFRLACLVVPLLYWFFGVTVVDASVPGVLSYFLPYFAAVLIVLNWISGGLIVPILNDVSQLLGAREITKAVVTGLLQPKNQKFKVTAKGGDRTRIVVQWPLLMPMLLAFLATLVGLLYAIVTDVVFERDPGDGKSVIITWTLYNLAVLAVTMAVCIELPRRATAHSPGATPVVVRFGTQRMRGWAMRLTAEDAWIRGGPLPERGASVELDLPAIGGIPARVTRQESAGIALELQPSATQRVALLTQLHTLEGAAGTRQTELGGLLTALGGRTLRGPRS
ncbi:glycosyltransferase family 2 protein [Falsiroseomonas tokyonensis]|uniref:Glycosyltransferase family 2 protein n=1 Tax=Falsiroseomonas tokyonensis TaxID=430521 RepID=A0ABV7BPH7_9PROT|nr:cellulose synthase catalytic subunit [Falsiroseomonas tokyonensis]MBU8537495.1 glycosyltransferase [Falsiroseomonas tokyonensis]